MISSAKVDLELTRPLTLPVTIEALSLGSRFRSWGVRSDTKWNRTIEKPAKLHTGPTIVVAIAMALPDGAGIVAFAFPVLSYAHLIRCGRRNNQHRACLIAAGFKISLCCTTVLCGTVWEPRYTGGDWGLSEGTLSV